MEKKKYSAEKQGYYRLTVMQPTVVNVSVPLPLENVAREGIVSRDPEDEKNIVEDVKNECE